MRKNPGSPIELLSWTSTMLKLLTRWSNQHEQNRRMTESLLGIHRHSSIKVCLEIIWVTKILSWIIQAFFSRSSSGTIIWKVRRHPGIVCLLRAPSIWHRRCPLWNQWWTLRLSWVSYQVATQFPKTWWTKLFAIPGILNLAIPWWLKVKQRMGPLME